MKKLILFDLKKEYYFNCFISILEAFKGDDRFEIAFYVGKNDERIWGIIPVYHKKRIEKWITAKGYPVVKSTSGYDAVVSGDALYHPENYGNAKIFVSDHGPGTKTLRIRNIVRQKDYPYTVFVEGSYWMDMIKKFGNENDVEWVKIGVPKLDTLFWKNYYNRKTILDNLGLDPDKKTVLFAPSYRPSCIPFLKTSIEKISEKYNLIIKLHPYSWGGKYASKSQSSMYEKLVKQNPNIVLIPKEDFDFHPYMYASDTVISDTSSALAICLAIGKVGIVADFEYPRMKHSDGMPIVSEEPGDYLKGVFVHMQDPSQLMKCVDKALFPSQNHIDKLLKHRDYYFTGLDGNAGVRAKEVIVDKLFK